MSDIAEKVSALPPLREIIREHDLRAEKSLGQNFLLDLNLTSKIARAAGKLDGATVFEIGPGPGGLTRALVASGAAKVIAVEYDPRAIQALQSLKETSNAVLEIVQADALHAELPMLAEQYGGKPPYVIVANLPYNIATPLLTGWMEQIYGEPTRYRSLTLMFQKEVAERIVAQAGDDAYGRLGVLAGWRSQAHIAFDVPRQAFVPPPNVTSAVVHLTPRHEPLPGRLGTLERVTEAAFGQRRKMIRGSLKDYMPFVQECGLREEARAEELSVAEFAALALCADKKI